MPDNAVTRPTMDRTREAVFSMLRAREAVMGAKVLDVFAGSGAYGFEALSQGAAHVTFFEQDQQAQLAIRGNIKAIGCETSATLISGDARKAPHGTPATLAFFDPPYHENLIEPALRHLVAQGWIGSNALLVLELEKDEPEPQGLKMLDTRVYGTSKIILARR